MNCYGEGRHETKGENKIIQPEKSWKTVNLNFSSVYWSNLFCCFHLKFQRRQVSCFFIKKRIIFPWKISERKKKSIYILAIQNQFSSQSGHCAQSYNHDLFFFSDRRPTTLYHHSMLVMEFLYDLNSNLFIRNPNPK